MKPKSLGQIAYEAWADCVSDQPIIKWEFLEFHRKWRWTRSANTVAREVRRRERKKR